MTNQRMRAAVLVAIPVLLFFMQACAGQPFWNSETLFRLERPFWTRAGETISVDFSPPGEAVSWRNRRSLFVDDHEVGVSEVFEPFRPEAFRLHEHVSATLRERGFSVTSPEGAGAGDPTLSISVTWGLSREYLGFGPRFFENEYLATVPIGEYQACFVIAGEIEQQMGGEEGWDYQVLWERRVRGCEPIGKRWRDADQRPVVEKAIAKAWAETTEKFEQQLFSWKGKWGVERTRRGTYQ